jgi:hypothetical protein
LRKAPKAQLSGLFGICVYSLLYGAARRLLLVVCLGVRFCAAKPDTRLSFLFSDFSQSEKSEKRNNIFVNS